MDPAQFFAASRLIIVAGKGGVGKTTVSAALARAASRTGLSAQIIEVEGKSGLAEMFGVEALGYDDVTYLPTDDLPMGGTPATDHGQRGAVSARTLTPDEALLEYLHTHGMKRISKRLVSSGALDIVSTAAPGIRDILILGKVKQLERAGAADVLILDAPAAGHAISFLRSARGLADAVRVGPIHTQAVEVLDLLTDEARCQVILVTLPEETPVNELIETAFNLEEEVGVSLGPVVVNGLYPPIAGLDRDPTEAADEAGAHLHPGEAEALASAASFRRQRTELQELQQQRLADQLPLPQLSLPFRFSSDLGPDDVEALAAAMLDGIQHLPALQGAAATAGEPSTGTAP